MSGINNKSGSATSRRKRVIKVAPMTRAVRVALAASLAALALSASGGAFAAGCQPPTEMMTPCAPLATDTTPVLDLTLVHDAAVPMGHGAFIMPLAISESDVGDVVIDNADPISEVHLYYSSTAIGGYSSAGSVDITNQSTGELEASSVLDDATGIKGYAYGDVVIDNAGSVDASSYMGNAIGLYGYSMTADVSIDNSADITVASHSGLADGIFASGADVEVTNSGSIDASGYTWAAGIEAQGSDSTVVSNDGDISVDAPGFYQQSSYSYTTYESAVLAEDSGSHAYGIYATGGDGGVQVDNSGNITVDAGYATGVEVQSSGDVTVDNSGSIMAGSGMSESSYYDPYTYTAYTYTYGTDTAFGINASSTGEGAQVAVTNSGDVGAYGIFQTIGINASGNGEYGTVTVDNSGAVTAEGYFGAYGISATATGTGGIASVTNSGSVYTSQGTKYGSGAYGVFVSADSDASIANTAAGSITVYSPGGAYGATALSFAGDASITNAGDIEATSTANKYYGASGMVAFAQNGEAYVGNSGSVSVASGNTARAIDASGYAGTTVVNNGSLYANGKYAYGIVATSVAGDVSVTNSETGSIEVYSGASTGIGVYGSATLGDVMVDNAGSIDVVYAYGLAAGVFGVASAGDVDVTNSGSISVYSNSGTGVGVFARADDGTASVDNSGAISAESYFGDVYGVLARGGYADVGNSGDISANGNFSAIGIAASSYYGSTVTTTGGSIHATAGGQANGIDARSRDGDVTVDNASSIEAVGFVLGAKGIQGYAYAYGNVHIDNSGDISAGSYYGDAIGLYGYSIAGDVAIHNDGDITALSVFGLADGIFASGANVDVANSGVVDVYGATWAAGIEAQGTDSTIVNNNGDISVEAPGFVQVNDYDGVIGSAPGADAFGIYATAGAGGLEIANAGNIAVNGGYATGIEAQSYGDIMISNSGAIVAGSAMTSYYNDGNGYTYYYGTQVATGINASSNGEDSAIQVTNGGDITANAIFGVSGIAATATGTGGTASAINNGSIYAGQSNKYGYGAYGIVSSADGDATVANTSTGSITVNSEGAANGATAMSFAGDASVTNAGDIDVSSSAQKYYGAIGLDAFAQNGEAFASNSGSISAVGSDTAKAISAAGFAGATVSNSGSLYASGKYAYGVSAESAAGDVSVSNTATGAIEAYSYAGRSFGVLGIATLGDVMVGNAGSIEVYAYGQAAGVFARAMAGDASVTNSGDITVISGGDIAVGVFARADYGTALVNNSGDIVASDIGNNDYVGDSAYGVLARGAYAEVNNSGNVDAIGSGYGTGIAASSVDGTTVATTGGSIYATASGALVGDYYTGYSLVGAAAGIDVQSLYGDVTVSNASAITALGLNVDATGIKAAGSASITVANSGSIEATAHGLTESGYAFGIYASSSGDVAVSNSGSVAAQADFEYATGVYAGSLFGDVTITSSGAVSAHSPHSMAVGLAGASYYGNVAIGNAGTVDVTSLEANAIGLLGNDLAGNVVISTTSSSAITATAEQGEADGIVGVSFLGDVTVSNGGSISANGYTAMGILANALYGPVMVVNSGTVNATGDDYAVGVAMYSATGSTLVNSGTISAHASTPDGQVAVLGSDAVDQIGNTGTLHGALITHGGDDSFVNGSGGVWDVDNRSTDFGDGNDSIVNNAGGLIKMTNGAIGMGAGPNNSFLNLGMIHVSGDDNLIDMGAGNVNAFTNVNFISFLDGGADGALTVTGDMGGTGALGLDVDLSTLSSDQLYVNGNMTANAVQHVDVLFDGMPKTAHTTIDFAHITGTSAAENFVPGQVLSYNYPRNFLDLQFGVSSQINAANTTPDVFSINLDLAGLLDSGAIAANVASGAAGMMNAQIGTLRQRLGVNPYGDAGKVMSAFFRYYTSEGDVSPVHGAVNFGQGGNFDYSLKTWGQEVGVNANLFEGFHAGVTIGSADGRQRLTGAGIGQNRMDGKTWGAYATWFAPQGFYVDLSGRWMAVDVDSISAAGNLQSRAHTAATNIEAGYPWTTASGFVITPQLQYTQTKVDGIKTIYGDRANFDGHGGTSSRGRLGVEFSKSFQTAGGISITPYGSVNAIREFDGEMTYTVADNFFGSTNIEGTSTMVDLGIGFQKNGWGVTAGANWVDGGALNSVVGGQVVVRFAW